MVGILRVGNWPVGDMYHVCSAGTFFRVGLVNRGRALYNTWPATVTGCASAGNDDISALSAENKPECDLQDDVPS
jgi:hypothetical protein